MRPSDTERFAVPGAPKRGPASKDSASTHSVATNPARRAWVNAMQRQGEPTCKLVLFTAQARKHFSASDIEAALRTASFTLQLRGHVGPRKAIFDSIRCGALPLIASDRSPLPRSR